MRVGGCLYVCGSGVDGGGGVAWTKLWSLAQMRRRLGREDGHRQRHYSYNLVFPIDRQERCAGKGNSNASKEKISS